MRRQGNFGAPSTILRAPRYVERSITVAAVLAGFGVAALAVGVVVGDVWGTVIASLGSALITVGLLSVLYDAYLKDVLLREIYGALKIEQNVHSIDLKEVVRKDRVDLSSLLSGADEIQVLPLDPGSWSHQEWHRIVEHASQGVITVKVYLPNHDSPHVDVLAQRLGVAAEELSNQIARMPTELALSWDQKKASSLGSTLEINLYGAVPAVGMLATQRGMMIEIPPALGYAATDRTALAVMLGSDGWSSLVTDFISEQFEEDRIPSYSESVRRPADHLAAPPEDSVRPPQEPRSEDR